MSDHVLKPSELKLLLRCNGIKNYKWKGFLNGGNFPKMLLENTLNNEVLIGKIVSSPTEELRIRPKLQHQNLNPLLEILCIDTSKIRILISPAVGKSIGNVIQDNSFVQHPMCYERKKSYARDVLSGVNYMHQNNVCLLNLNDANVEIDAYTDKAVICDFSYAASLKKITVNSLPSGTYYRPPEVENANNGDVFSAGPIDVWYCGLLFLQIFTQHLLPWCGAVKNSLEYLDGELLRKANVGASLQQRDAIYLKRFLKVLLYLDPDLRISADEAFKLDFIQPAHDRLDREARHFWKTCAFPVHQEQKFLNENNFASRKIGPFYSEIDILTVSEENAPQNRSELGQCSSVGVDQPIDMAHLLRTQSEPGISIILDEPLSPDIQVHASVPALYRKSNCSVSEVYSATRLQEGLPSCSRRQSKAEGSLIEDVPRYNEEVRRSPYDIFLSEWEPDFLSNILNPDGEETAIESEQIFRSSFASSLESMPAAPTNRLRVGPSPTMYNLCSENSRKSRDANGSSDYCDSEPDAWYEYLEIQRQKQLQPAPPYTGEDDSAMRTSNFLLDAKNRSKTSLSKSGGRPSGRNLTCDLPQVSDTSIDIFESCKEIPSSSMKRDRSKSEVILRVRSEEKPLPGVSNKLKNDSRSSEDAKVRQIVDNESLFNHERSETPPPRRRWYHKLCPGCKSRRKKGK